MRERERREREWTYITRIKIFGEANPTKIRSTRWTVHVWATIVLVYKPITSRTSFDIGLDKEREASEDRRQEGLSSNPKLLPLHVFISLLERFLLRTLGCVFACLILVFVKVKALFTVRATAQPTCRPFLGKDDTFTVGERAWSHILLACHSHISLHLEELVSLHHFPATENFPFSVLASQSCWFVEDLRHFQKRPRL